MYFAFLAAIFFFIKDGVPWAMAQMSGRIRSRGHKREIVYRAVDSQKFQALALQRFKGLGLGLAAMGVGFIWGAWSFIVALAGAVSAAPA